jgi:hypothetical protein
MRQFKFGASRNNDTDKLDFEGFLNPLVLEEFAKYMHKHRKLESGELRGSDNWQAGITKESYMKSMWRHLHDLWMFHRGYKGRETKIDALCGILFNAQGYLLEELRDPQ